MKIAIFEVSVHLRATGRDADDNEVLGPPRSAQCNVGAASDSDAIALALSSFASPNQRCEIEHVRNLVQDVLVVDTELTESALESELDAAKKHIAELEAELAAAPCGPPILLNKPSEDEKTNEALEELTKAGGLPVPPPVSIDTILEQEKEQADQAAAKPEAAPAS